MKNKLSFLALLIISFVACGQTEPANHVTGFTATTNSPTSITLSWTDATGSPQPEFYLIVGRILPGGTFVTVNDGPEIQADNDWSDGNFAAIVAHAGPDFLSVTGLNPQTGYEFKIYSYRESGGNANYKIGGEPTASTFTYALEPGAHAASFTATLNGTVNIDLAFSAAGTITNAAGYLIYRRAGSAVNLTGLNDGAAPPSPLNGAVLIATTTPAQTTYSDVGLQGGITYHYALVPFNYDGSNPATYNYRNDGSVPQASATTTLVITLNQITGGVAASPLASGSTNQAILGFSVTTNGPTTLHTLNVPVTSTPIGKFLNPRLFSSADNSFDGGDVSINNGTLSATQLQFTGINQIFSSAGTYHFFVVVHVTTTVNASTPPIQPSFNQTNITFINPSAMADPATLTGINYSFIDTTPPVIVSTVPADDATNVSVTLTTLQLNFSENIVYDGDNSNPDEQIRLRNVEAATFVEVINPANISVFGSSVTITITTALSPGTNYAVYIGNSVFKDQENNYFPGINNDTDWNFQTESAPQITGYSANPTCMDEVLTITGTGFGITTPAVSINGIAVTPSSSTPTSVRLTVPYTTAGTATVVVTNTTNGLSDSDNTLVLKEAITPSLPLSSTPPSPLIDQDYQIQVGNTQTSVNYRLREIPNAFGASVPGNGGMLTFSNVFNKSVLGTYQYEVRAESAGCTSRTYGPLMINIAALGANAGNDTTICVGSEVRLGGNPTAIGGTGFYSITWTAMPHDPSLSGQITSSNPVVRPAQTTTYTVTVDDSSPATPATDQVTITVNTPTVSSDDITIVLNPSRPNNTYQREDTNPVDLSFTINGNPGTFTGQTRFEGPGVNTQLRKFYPNAANSGANQIILYYENPNGCITTDTVIVFIRDQNIFLAGLDAQYCQADGIDHLTVQTPILFHPIGFSFFGTDLTLIPGRRYTYLNRIRLGNDTDITTPDTVTNAAAFSYTGTNVQINPGFLTPGLKQLEIFYRVEILNYSSNPLNYPVVNTFEEIVPVQFEVIERPVILHFMPGEVCENEPPFILNVNPPGGSFTLNGNPSVNTFNPGLAGLPDDNTIVYNYTDPSTNCSNSITHQITIRRIPGLDLSFRNGCKNDSIPITAVFSNPHQVQFNYQVDFGNLQFYSSPDSTPRTVKTLYNVPSVYPLKLTIKTEHNCSGSISRNIIIGDVPDLTLRWFEVCDSVKTLFRFTSSFFSTQLSSVDSVIWEFGDGHSQRIKNPVAQNDTITHFYTSRGNFTARAGLITTLGCRRYDTVSVYKVKHVKIITGNDYLEDFNGTDLNVIGWVSGGENSSWQWGTPAGVLINNDADGGGKAWVTNLTGSYNVNEDSWVHSPCFDLDSLDRPYLQLFFRSLTRNQVDGAVLQYNYKNTTDVETDWIRVDAFDAENWYNGVGILSNPGNQQVLQLGWTGLIDSTRWRSEIIALDQVISTIPPPFRNRVRFRIAFSSSQFLAPFEGFAFDNFGIGTRNRIVLIEQFTNNGGLDTATEPNKVSNELINNFISAGTGEAVKLEYHVGFPGPNPDPIYLRTSTDATARAAFYGITQTPYTKINGKTGNFIQLVQKESLKPAPVSIDTIITPPVPADKLNIQVKITAKQDLPPGTALHIAVLESVIDTAIAWGTNGETQFYNVLRKLLPDANGTRFIHGILKDVTHTVSYSWIPEAYRADRLKVVVFVQNMITREVYQARLMTPTYIPPVNIITAIENNTWADRIQMYPNPASRVLNIVLPEPAREMLSFALTDTRGRTVGHYHMEAGQQQLTISIEDLTSGLYILQIQSNYGTVRKKLMVVASR